MSQRARVSKRLAETESQWEPECEPQGAKGPVRATEEAIKSQKKPKGARERWRASQ